MAVSLDCETAVVTGGAGFIGGHLTRALLARGVEVTVYDNLQSSTREDVPAGATFIEADIRNRDRMDAALEDTDVVFHHAAVVSVGRSVEAPLECHDTNANGTLQLLELARNHDVRVVLPSSSAVYGQPNYTPIDESHPLKPTSPYGIDKATIDRYARTYHDLYGLETVVLRYFNAYGPGQTAGNYGGVISIFAKQARAENPITVNDDGSQTRDFVHVSDIVQANLLAAETDHVGEAFNIGTGTTISIASLAATIREVLDSDSEITYGEPRPGDIQDSVADIEKANELLGFAPTLSVYDGLETFL